MSKFGNLSGAVDSDLPRQMEVANPFTGLPLASADGKKATISLYSADSKIAQAFERKLLDARALSKVKITASAVETEMLMRAAELTAEWALVDLDGAVLDVPCTQANAVDLYKELPWVYEQVLDFTRSRNNYKRA